MARIPAGTSRPMGYFWAQGQSRAPLQRIAFKSKKEMGERAWRVMIDGTGGPWRLTTKKLLHRHAPIENQGAVLRSVIGAVIGNPVTYTYRAVLEQKGSTPMAGLMEITFTDE